MPYRILGDDEDYAITPGDIDIEWGKEFVGVFNLPENPTDSQEYADYMNRKMNEGASIVVNTCQEQGHWGPFKPFERVYAHEEGTFSLNEFLHNRMHRFHGMVVLGDDGFWRVTDAFVLYCYYSAPKIRRRKQTLGAGTVQIRA